MAIERIDDSESDKFGEFGAVYAPRWDGLRRDDKVSAGDSSALSLRRDALALMDGAAVVLADDPERARWLLDRVARALVRFWFASCGAAPRSSHDESDALDAILRADPHVARQLLLARRSSDVSARLRHYRAMLVLIEREDVGLEAVDAGCGARHVAALDDADVRSAPSGRHDRQ